VQPAAEEKKKKKVWSLYLFNALKATSRRQFQMGCCPSSHELSQSASLLPPLFTSDPLRVIREAVIGVDAQMSGPFGRRTMTYADYTASGRCLSFVEDYLRAIVMPTYGNTHTEASHAGLETSRHVENARRTIMASLNGSEIEHAVIFTGSGSTSAIAKLIDCLEIRLPHGLNTKYSLLEKIPAGQRPVVFVGPMEHHSNELMWRETIADVVVIDEDEYGFPDLVKLKEQLEIFNERPLKIGTFSAGSNVTGILPPQVALTNLLHEHKALSCWDFAIGLRCEQSAAARLVRATKYATNCFPPIPQ
jgi:selenocysteine lyase/cysteine desulfurase